MNVSSLPWQEFGGQEDMLFCGVFDGHGPWGHYVAKMVRESMPSSLLCNWQETLAEVAVDSDIDIESEKRLHKFNIWKHSYIKTCAAIDQELEHHRGLDSFNSGTTALTIVRQVSQATSLPSDSKLKIYMKFSTKEVEACLHLLDLDQHGFFYINYPGLKEIILMKSWKYHKQS